MTQSESASNKFERIAKSIVEKNGETGPASASPLNRDLSVDFVFHYAGIPWQVEVKYYRTERVQLDLLERAAARLTHAVQRIGGNAGGALIVSFSVPAEVRTTFEEKFGIVLVDRSELYLWAASAGNQFLQQLAEVLEIDLDTPATGSVLRSFAQAWTPRRPPSSIAEPAPSRGADLCIKLKSLKSGGGTRAGIKNWRAYEEHCAEILDYLFSADLTGWQQQNSTDDGLSKFDLVCRIKPSREFWQFLIHDLDTRYIVFEFKNYSKPIKQYQILTTEKYLFEKGLRKVAVVLTRRGADENAIKMAKGAMREQGKLLLILKDEDLCKMLKIKDEDGDPSDHLFALADSFFLSLAR